MSYSRNCQYLFSVFTPSPYALSSAHAVHSLSQFYPIGTRRFVQEAAELSGYAPQRHVHSAVSNRRHQCLPNFAVNLLSAIAAYCFFPKKPSINIVKVLIISILCSQQTRRTHVELLFGVNMSKIYHQLN